MVESQPLSARLRAARRTGLGAIASRNRVFGGLVLFSVAGACLVSAAGSLVDRVGVLPDPHRVLIAAVAAAVLGLALGVVEAARGGRAREAYALIGLHALVVVAALALLP